MKPQKDPGHQIFKGLEPSIYDEEVFLVLEAGDTKGKKPRALDRETLIRSWSLNLRRPRSFDS
jgi:hypothetical protein